jgi:hypothetical protein
MSANLKTLTSVTAGALLSQQLGTSEAALYTVPAATTVKVAQGTMCNVTGSAAAPVLTLGTTSTTGGTLAAATYYWKVTGKAANGETVGSNEVTATTTGTTSSQPLSWTAVGGATSYNIYRGTTAGGENLLIANVTSGLTYTDIGAVGSTGYPPATSTFSTDVTVFLSVVKSGGTMGDGTHRVINNYTLKGNDTLPLEDYIAGHMLGPGDIIAGYASAATSVDIVISGTVLT